MRSIKLFADKVLVSLSIGLLITSSMSLKAQKLSTADSLAFVSRCNYVINCYDLSKVNTSNFDLRQAGYLIGAMVLKNFSLADINAFAMKLIKNFPIPNNSLREQSFHSLPMIYSYIKYNSYFADSTKQAYKDKLTVTNFRDTGTYNQRIMLATVRYLVGQTWPDVVYNDSSKFQLNDPDAKAFLISRMSSIVINGLGEYASTPYAPFSMLSFLAIADVGADPEMKNKARMTYEATLVQAIAASVKGVYMGATGRSYPNLYPANASGHDLMSYIWPYTGLGGLPSTPRQSAGSNLLAYRFLMPCLADYRFPANLLRLATNRTDGTIAKAFFEGDYQYSYFNNDYGIFSQREFTVPFYQSMRSGVNWINTDTLWKKNTNLWFTHPYADSAFADVIHTHGVTPYERVAQYLGTTVHNYNIPNVDSIGGNYIQKFALGYIPGSYSAIIDNGSSGKVFLNYDKVLIAISSSNAFDCDSLTAPSSAVSNHEKPGDFMVRIKGLKFGLAIETADPKDYAGTPMQKLLAFKNQIDQNTIIYNSSDSSTNYTDRFGNLIRCSANTNAKAADSINNNLIDYSKWPTLSCPGIFETKTGNLVVTYNNQRTFYDFNNWTITYSNDTVKPKLLDTLSVQPKAAYSTRLLRTVYTGPALRVRRSNDSAQINVYFDSTGIVSLFSRVSSNGLNRDTLFSQWAGNSNVFVTIWYDQTGKGINATQTTLSYQPRILNQGVLETLDNGTPAIRMINGGNGGTGFNLPFTLSGVNRFDLFIANQVDTSARLAAYHLFGSSGPTGTTPGLFQANYSSSNSSIGMTSSAAALSNNKLYVVMSDFKSVRFRCTPDNNGTFLISTINESDSALAQSLTTPFNNTAVTLFRIGNATYNRNFQGLSNEVIYFDTTISEAIATTIFQNQENAFSINPALNNINNNLVLPKPTLTAATGISSKRAIVNWLTPRGTIPRSSTYTLQYSTTQNFSSSSTTLTGIPITANSQTIYKLIPAKQYWYRLLIDANGGGYNQNDGPWSSIGSVTTTPAQVTTIWNGSAWSNSAPDSNMNGIIAANLNNSNTIGTFTSCDTLTINNGVTFTLSNSVTLSGSYINNGIVSGSGTILLLKNTSQTVSGSGTINNLTLNNPAGASITGTLAISGILTLQLGQLTTTNGNLILLSDSSGNSGTIAPIDSITNFGSINGNVTVQRYIPAKSARKFSFIGSAVEASVRNGWQQQIYITGAGNGGTPCGSTTSNGGNTDKYNANGFDASITNAASMFTFNDRLVNGSRFQSIANTINTNLSPGKGYRVNVRGNRNSASVSCFNQLQTANPAPPEAVILSATGKLTIGSLSVSLNDTDYSSYTLVANPYPSAISFTAFQANNNTNIYNRMWTYSPFSNGNYTTYSNGIIANAATGYDNLNGDRIATGQAFFVQATAAGSLKTVQFKESCKVKFSIPNTQYFGVKNEKLLRIGLKSSSNSLLDEVVVRFNRNVTNASYHSFWDAESLSNSNQVLQIVKGSRSLAIATYSDILNQDTVELFLSSNTTGAFSIHFSDYQNMDSNYTIILLDRYLNNSQDLKANPIYSFNITSDTLSKGSNRFKIIFSKTITLPLIFTNLTAIQIAKRVAVSWTVANELNIAYYIIEKSIDGISFFSVATKKGSNTSRYTIDDENIPNNINIFSYRIKAVSSLGTYSYSKVVRLTATTASLINIYPNPIVSAKEFSIQLANIEIGKYYLNITNSLGQQVSEQTLSYSGGNKDYSIAIQLKLPAGIYHLNIYASERKKLVFQSKLILQYR